MDHVAGVAENCSVGGPHPWVLELGWVLTGALSPDSLAGPLLCSSTNLNFFTHKTSLIMATA